MNSRTLALATGLLFMLAGCVPPQPSSTTTPAITGPYAIQILQSGYPTNEFYVDAGWSTELWARMYDIYSSQVVSPQPYFSWSVSPTGTGAFVPLAAPISSAHAQFVGAPHPTPCQSALPYYDTSCATTVTVKAISGGPSGAIGITGSIPGAVGVNNPLFSSNIVQAKPVFACQNLSSSGRLASARGMLTTDASACDRGQPVPTGFYIAPRNSRSHILAANLGGTKVYRCDLACRSLPCAAPLGALTTDKSACWNHHGVETGWTLLPYAGSNTPSVSPPTGSKPSFVCNNSCNDPRRCYPQGMITTAPQYCATSPPGGFNADVTDIQMPVN